MLRIQQWVHWLFSALAVVATIAGIMIIALVGTSVAMRHLVNAPFRFTEELVGLLMTAAFFLALPLATLNAEHVKVQIILNTLPRQFATWLSCAAAVFGCVFTLWFFWLCLPWFEFAFNRNIKTEVGRLLMYPWMAILPISMILTFCAFAFQVIQALNSSNPKIKH